MSVGGNYLSQIGETVKQKAVTAKEVGQHAIGRIGEVINSVKEPVLALITVGTLALTGGCSASVGAQGGGDGVPSTSDTNAGAPVTPGPVESSINSEPGDVTTDEPVEQPNQNEGDQYPDSQLITPQGVENYLQSVGCTNIETLKFNDMWEINVYQNNSDNDPSSILVNIHIHNDGTFGEMQEKWTWKQFKNGYKDLCE